MKQTKQKTSGAAVPIMDAEAISRALRRVAHEIIERNPQLTRVVLAGIPSRGVEIAQRIARFIHEIEKINVETGVIDVEMHRDDVGTVTPPAITPTFTSTATQTPTFTPTPSDQTCKQEGACFVFEYLGYVTDSVSGQSTISFRVTNKCRNAVSYVAIG